MCVERCVRALAKLRNLFDFRKLYKRALKIMNPAAAMAAAGARAIYAHALECGADVWTDDIIQLG